MRRLHRLREQLSIPQRHHLAVVGHPVAGHQAGGDLQSVFEEVESLAGARERDAELGVLLVVPGGAEGQLEASARGVVDGHHLVGEHRGVPVGDAGDEEPQPDPRRHPGEGGEGGDPVEGLAWAVAVHRLEVVEPPGPVEAEVLGEPDSADHLVEGHPLLGNVKAEPHPLRLRVCRDLLGRVHGGVR